jgi:hypothetical protein
MSTENTNTTEAYPPVWFSGIGWVANTQTDPVCRFADWDGEEEEEEDDGES